MFRMLHSLPCARLQDSDLDSPPTEVSAVVRPFCLPLKTLQELTRSSFRRQEWSRHRHGTTTAPLHLTCGGIPALGAPYRSLHTFVNVLMFSIRDRRSRLRSRSNYWRTGRPHTDVLAQASTGSSSRPHCEFSNLSLPLRLLMLNLTVLRGERDGDFDRIRWDISRRLVRPRSV